MIRVLHTIDTTGPGGAETVFINLVKGLDPEEFESVVAIRGPGWVQDSLKEKGIEPLFIQSRGGFNFKYLIELVRIVRQHKIDVIQSHLFGSNVYCSMVGLICQIPIISTIHGFVDTKDKERLMWLKTKLINWGSKKIVFVSDRLREHYVNKKGFSTGKSITIYNGVDTSEFYPQKDDCIRKELGFGPEHVVIGAVGNIRPAKGYYIFLKAAQLIYKQHPECRFIVAGQGTGKLYDDLLELRTKLGLNKVFQFIGFQNDASKVFNNFDIFVLPSVSEGFSISTIEAMACGLPVIVTKSGGPEEIVEHDFNGLTVECSDRAISRAIDRLFVEKELSSWIVKHSVESVSRNYCINSIFRSYQALYR
ncbi:glycosyltransferase family 4 protein [Desulforhopalus sp. 52FAK]